VTGGGLGDATGDRAGGVRGSGTGVATWGVAGGGAAGGVAAAQAPTKRANVVASTGRILGTERRYMAESCLRNFMGSGTAACDALSLRVVPLVLFQK
jgi:hypothetical protein